MQQCYPLSRLKHLKNSYLGRLTFFLGLILSRKAAFQVSLDVILRLLLLHQYFILTLRHFLQSAYQCHREADLSMLDLAYLVHSAVFQLLIYFTSFSCLSFSFLAYFQVQIQCLRKTIILELQLHRFTFVLLTQILCS